MNKKEQFALALRIIGVLGIIYIARAFTRLPDPGGLYWWISRLVCLAIGVYFVRGACLVVNFAYPQSAPEQPDKAP